MHISPGVEVGARVALASAEDVAGDGVQVNLGQGARHAEGAATHGDGGLAARFIFDAIGIVEMAHVGGFAAAINVGEDMATLDNHRGVAIHFARLTIPNSGIGGVIMISYNVRIVTRAAAKHVAEPSLAVGRNGVLTQKHRVERLVKGNFVICSAVIGFTIVPADTFGQSVIRSHIVEIGMLRREIGIRVEELVGAIVQRILVIVMASTYLSAFDGHLGIVQHVAVHGAAIH